MSTVQTRYSQKIGGAPEELIDGIVINAFVG